MRMDYPAPSNGCTFKQAIQIFKDMYLKDKLSKHFPYRFINLVESEKDYLYIATLYYYDEDDNVLELATFTPYYMVTCDNDFMQVAETQKYLVFLTLYLSKICLTHIYQLIMTREKNIIYM